MMGQPQPQYRRQRRYPESALPPRALDPAQQKPEYQGDKERMQGIDLRLHRLAPQGRRNRKGQRCQQGQRRARRPGPRVWRPTVLL